MQKQLQGTQDIAKTIAGLTLSQKIAGNAKNNLRCAKNKMNSGMIQQSSHYAIEANKQAKNWQCLADVSAPMQEGTLMTFVNK